MDRHKNRKKYKFLSINGKTVKEHRLVMENAVGRKLSRWEIVHHKDDNGMNNNLNNLEIVPYGEHSRLEGRNKRPKAKLQPDDVGVIRKMIKDNIAYKLIAWIYQVNRRTISDISTGATWSWA
uniref:Putative homing endonuclease n=1 Tax=viral metagenome TaxID=1070528 RepID=A0A6H1ZNE6_9ZZZZ